LPGKFGSVVRIPMEKKVRSGDSRSGPRLQAGADQTRVVQHTVACLAQAVQTRAFQIGVAQTKDALTRTVPTKSCSNRKGLLEGGATIEAVRVGVAKTRGCFRQKVTGLDKRLFSKKITELDKRLSGQNVLRKEADQEGIV
jgi:hypothetical protein